jgi:hypothetical protein
MNHNTDSSRPETYFAIIAALHKTVGELTQTTSMTQSLHIDSLTKEAFEAM